MMATPPDSVLLPPDSSPFDAATTTIDPHSRLWPQTPTGATPELRLDDTAKGFLTALMSTRGLLPEEYAEKLLASTGNRLDGYIAKINAALVAAGPDSCFVAHYPGRGYELVGPPPLQLGGRFATLPAPRGSLFGLDDLVESLAARLKQHRFMTIVGHGGMGKTTLAVELAARHQAFFEAGICFVDLAPVASAGLVPSAVYSALGKTLGLAPKFDALANYVRPRKLLVILDSCEHLISSLADVAEALLAAGPEIFVLATSRERLAAKGERVHQLSPLELPDGAAVKSQVRPLEQYAGIQLFLERARASAPGFQPESGELATVAQLCTQLNGVPLAIELAAARLGTLGLPRLKEGITDDLLECLGTNGEGAQRHRTLAALYDWSYRLLTVDERAALRQLSVFRGWFSIESASAVVVTPTDSCDVASLVLDLASKSLVTWERNAKHPRYRLLDTARAYAAGKMDADEAQQVSIRHARLMQLILEDAQHSWERLSRAEWSIVHSNWVDDIRHAIDWALSDDGDARLGVELTIGVHGVANQVGLKVEFEGRVKLAMARLGTMEPQDPVLRARLLASFPRIIHWQDVEEAELTLESLEGTQQFLLKTDDPRDRMTSLTSTWLEAAHCGLYEKGLACIEKFRDSLKGDDDPYGLLERRLRAYGLEFTGRHREAASLARYVQDREGYKPPFLASASAVDGVVSSRVVLSRSLWVLGQADTAMDVALEAAQKASLANPYSECLALSLCSIPVALWRGDTSQANELIEYLRTVSEAHQLSYWLKWSQLFGELSLSLKHEGGLEELSTPCIASLAGAADAFHRDHVLTVDGRLLARTGFAPAVAGGLSWCRTEHLRIAAFDAPPAECRALLKTAISEANAADQLAWELRATTALALTHEAAGEPEHIRPLLEPLVARFKQGHSTRDLRIAANLLERTGRSTGAGL